MDRQHWGVVRYVVSPCDEVAEDGRAVRTWDVMRDDVCVHSGFRTRREAQGEADQRNGVYRA
jgi:hypothetical protein